MFGNLHRNVHDPVVSHVQPLQVLDDGEDVDGEQLQPQPREVEIAELVPHLLHRPQAERLQADDLEVPGTQYLSSASEQKKKVGGRNRLFSRLFFLKCKMFVKWSN